MQINLTQNLIFTLFIVANFSFNLTAQAGDKQESSDAPAIEVTGDLTVIHLDDFENKRSEKRFMLEDKHNNRHFELIFSSEPPVNLLSGNKIRVRGKQKNEDIYLAADDKDNVETITQAATIVSGEQKTLVMMTNFQDKSVSCPIQDIQDLMFTDPDNQSVDNLYQEISHGKIWLSGQVAGPYTINHQSTDSCDVNAWALAADQAAQAEGIDLNSYDRKVYVMPSENSCGWSGLASVGGSPSQAWIFRCDLEGVYAHEFGHNLGMNHASTLAAEYGDTSDPMGSALSGLHQLNGPHQEQMGWRSPDKIITVTQEGIFYIAPLELEATQTDEPQVLKIAKPDSNDYYYLSYRQPIGFDANLSTSLTQRLHIHLYKGNGGRTTFISGLLEGASFVDDVNDITITHVSRTPDFITVEVQFEGGSNPPPTCNPASPQVSLSPTGQSANAGATLSYSVSVTNNDNSTCADSTFTLNNSIPVGWTGALSATGMSLAPGQTGTTTFSVTSVSNAAPGTYNASVNVVDTAVIAHTASANASYTVIQSCIANAPSLTLSPSSQSGDAGTTLGYAISLNNNDSAACSVSTFNMAIASLPSGWSDNLSSTILSLLPGATASVTLLVSSTEATAAGSYSVQIAVSDNNENQHSKTSAATYLVNDMTSIEDSEAPTAPTELSASSNFKQVSLTWAASTDNVGVTGYKIYRDDIWLTNSVDPSYTDSTGADRVVYKYSVYASDAAGNISSSSAPVMAGKAKAKSKGSDGTGGGGKGKGKNK